MREMSEEGLFQMHEVVHVALSHGGAEGVQVLGWVVGTEGAPEKYVVVVPMAPPHVLEESRVLEAPVGDLRKCHEPHAIEPPKYESGEVVEVFDPSGSAWHFCKVLAYASHDSLYIKLVCPPLEGQVPRRMVRKVDPSPHLHFGKLVKVRLCPQLEWHVGCVAGMDPIRVAVKGYGPGFQWDILDWFPEEEEKEKKVEGQEIELYIDALDRWLRGTVIGQTEWPGWYHVQIHTCFPHICLWHGQFVPHVPTHALSWPEIRTEVKYLRGGVDEERLEGFALRGGDDILLAWYGPQPSEGKAWDRRLGRYVTAQCKELLSSGQPVCADGNLFGDASPSAGQVLRIEYEVDGEEVRLSGSAALCASITAESVLRAWFGDRSCRGACETTEGRGRHVTRHVKHLLSTGSKVSADAEVFGDPCPGVDKVLIVRYDPKSGAPPESPTSGAREESPQGEAPLESPKSGGALVESGSLAKQDDCGREAQILLDDAGTGDTTQEKPAVKLLSRQEVQEVLASSACGTDLVLPLEHRLWSREELTLFVMSHGSVRPAWCSIKGAHHYVMEDQSEEEVAQALQTAADWLVDADALLVGSGAGMGVNSGLATFRGGRGGVWPALESLGMAYEDICDAKWFLEDPRLAWGFWLFCHQAYREAKPHEGYDLVKHWAERLPCGGFSFTSNIDSHWGRSGWPRHRLLECHGAVRWLQCSVPCREALWEAPTDLGLQEDPRSHRVVGELPVCPHCGAVARPCVLMFGDDTGFSVESRREQALSYRKWRRSVQLATESPMFSPKTVCLELGCGITVPTVRKELEGTMTREPETRLIRVNPENPGVPKELASRSVCIPLGAKEALKKLDKLVQERVGPDATFVVFDEQGGAAEVVLPQGTPMYKVAMKAFLEVHFVANEPPESPRAVAVHVLQQEKMMEVLDWSKPVPPATFFQCDAPGHPPLVKISVCHGRFYGWNGRFERRVGQVQWLVKELLEEFSTCDYQGKLQNVSNRLQLLQLIRSVHLQVLPRHGFQVAEGLHPAKWHAELARLQAFIQSCNNVKDIRGMSDGLQEKSGAWSPVARVQSSSAAKSGAGK